MKYLILLAFLSGFLLSLGNASQEENLYQVITSHPEDISELEDNIETVSKRGRLWVVKLKPNATPDVLKHLELLQEGERSYFYRPDEFGNMKQTKTFSSAILDQADKELIRKDVEDLSQNYVTRLAGTDENKAAVKSVSERFKAMNYEVKEICYGFDSCSLIAEKKGASLPDKVIMVEGHIDSVGESYAGADDNASGVAVILEMARILKDVPNRKTLRFFISNGEEGGLLGSEHYARALKMSNELKKIELVINMDMVAYNSNGIVELETEPEHGPLAQWFAQLAKAHTKLRPKITLGAWGSDHVPFLKRGVPSMLTIEDWDTKTPCYHQECDTAEKLNFDYALQITRLNLSAVLSKDLL